MIILLFMYIFSFPVFNILPSLLHSTNLVGVFLGSILITNRKYREEFLKIYRDIRVTRLVLYSITLIALSALFVTLHGSGDYSIVPTFMNLSLKLIIGTLLFSYIQFLRIHEKREVNIISLMVMIFVFQSIVQIISFVVPPVNILFDNFRLESVVARANQLYNGVRGLAISGTGFYGLAICYGFILFIYLAYRKQLFDSIKIINKSKVRYIVVLIVLLVGGVSAGRTSLVGLFFGIIYVIFEKTILANIYPSLKLRQLPALKSNEKRNLSIIFLFAFTLVLSGIIFISRHDSSSEMNPIMQRVFGIFRYSFDGMFTLFHTGTFDISSLRTLFGMYFSVSLPTFLVGTGRYTNPDGSYFMQTDAGYMRNILFFGILGFLILFIFQLLFFDWRKKSQWYQNIFVLVLFLIYHIKGEVIGFAQMLSCILLLLFLDSINNHREEKRKYEPAIYSTNANL